MPTYADVCRRGAYPITHVQLPVLLTYADVCRRMLTYAGEAPIQSLTSNYRFFFKFERLPDTYIYYQINHGFDSRDVC
jgi:hypothetical protein